MPKTYQINGPVACPGCGWHRGEHASACPIRPRTFHEAVRNQDELLSDERPPLMADLDCPE